jgi:hypothetical protein
MKGTQDLVNAAHAALERAGLRMSPSKVSRLVRIYQREVAANGFPFLRFLANQLALTDEQQREVGRQLENYRSISYRDKTGDDAVTNVMRGKREKTRT